MRVCLIACVAWVAWMRGSIKFWRGSKKKRRAWRGFIKVWRGSKKGVSGVGPNFGVDGVGLRCFVKKVLLKVSQNLQQNACGGPSC